MTDIERFIKSKKLSQIEFSQKTGINKYELSRLVNGKITMSTLNVERIQSVYPDFKPNVAQLNEIKEDPNGKEIPFFNQEVYGTISPVLDDYITMQPYAIKKIPMFMAADGAVQVKGHSMKGYINNGDWIVIKKITNRNFIIYGEPYLVISKSDNLKTVKFVKESMDNPDCLTLIPYNIEQFEPQDIPKDEILELYAIVGLFRSM